MSANSPDFDLSNPNLPGLDLPDLELKVIPENLPAKIVAEIKQELGADGTWQNLKSAISQTSGFKRWQRSLHLVDANENNANAPERVTPEVSTEDVSRYLRETLETLAY
jgi:hypothetical protein